MKLDQEAIVLVLGMCLIFGITIVLNFIAWIILW